MRHRVNLLDMWIDKIDVTGTVAQIDSFARNGRAQGRSYQIVTVNVDFLRLGSQNAAFRDLINTSDLAVPDGKPLLWGARMLKDPLPERVTGIELIGECAALAVRKGYSIFLLGAREGVAAQAAAVLKEQHPGLRIAGIYSPPVGPFSKEDEDQMVRMVQEVQPDMLFVAFGAPRQDLWIRKHMQRLNVPLCMGVGGSLDMIAGRVKRAPLWMREGGLEWLYRFSQEPTRLWKRYFVDDLPVFGRLMAQWITGSPSARSVTALLEGYPTFDGPPAVESVEVKEDEGVHVA